MTSPAPRLPPRRRAALAGVAGLLLSLVACSSGGGTTAVSSAAASAPGTATGAATGTARIVIKDFLFDPASLTVAPGTVVTVVNQDQTTHTLTATGGHAFDTGSIGGGKTVTFTAPATAGAYPYICSIHQYMKGTLTVG